LDLFTSSVLNTEIWKYDVTAIGAAWNPKPQLEDGTKLRIGVLDEHHLLPLHPPVRRALQTATQALAAAGHEIVRITQDGGRDIALGNRIAFQYFTYAPHPDQIAASGEPPVPSVAKRAHPMFTGPSPVSTDFSDFELINELQGCAQAGCYDWPAGTEYGCPVRYIWLAAVHPFPQLDRCECR
jgi:amidase